MTENSKNSTSVWWFDFLVKQFDWHCRHRPTRFDSREEFIRTSDQSQIRMKWLFRASRMRITIHFTLVSGRLNPQRNPQCATSKIATIRILNMCTFLSGIIFRKWKGIIWSILLSHRMVTNILNKLNSCLSLFNGDHCICRMLQQSVYVGRNHNHTRFSRKIVLIKNRVNREAEFLDVFNYTRLNSS